MQPEVDVLVRKVQLDNTSCCRSRV